MVAKGSPERGVGYLLADVSRLFRQDFDRRVRSLKLSQAQWRAIGQLARDDGINQKTLAERLEVKPITLARLIDRMEAAGWVRREADAEDRRASLLFLTPKVQPILDEMRAHADAVLEKLMAGIPRADRRDLIEMLERMKRNLLEADSTAQSELETGTKN